MQYHIHAKFHSQGGTGSGFIEGPLQPPTPLPITTAPPQVIYLGLLGLSVPIIPLLTFFTLIFLSFEEKTYLKVSSKLIFITLGIKLVDSFFFSLTFFTIRLFNFIWLLIQPCFVNTIYNKIHILKEKTIQMF